MPFATPPPAAALPGLTLHWWQQFAGGAPSGGDALFVETGRPDRGVLLLLADVMGKGPGAAVTVALLRRMLTDPGCGSQSPAGLLTLLHSRLAPHWAETGRHVEALVLLALPEGAPIAGSRAGGAPQPWCGADGSSWVEGALPGGPWLGMPFDAPYDEGALAWPPGGRLVAFTDGVAEAGACSKELFRSGPLQTFFGGPAAGSSASAALPLLIAAARAHAQPDALHDDATAVALDRHVAPPPGPEEKKNASRASSGREPEPAAEGGPSMQGKYDEVHAQMMRVIARRHPYAPPEDEGDADKRTCEQEERCLVKLLRAAVRERFTTSRSFSADYEALRRACGKLPEADESFKTAVHGVVDQTMGTVLEEVLKGRTYAITAAYLDQHLRNALLAGERPGRKERSLPDNKGAPAGAWDVPETLEREAQQRQEHLRLYELLRQQQGSPALGALLRLWGEETTAELMDRLVDHLLPAYSVADFQERLERLLADFDDLRRDAAAFPREGPGARKAGLLLDAWLGGWDVNAGEKMKFYQVYAGRHGLKTASTVSNWLTCLRDQVCSKLDLCSRDEQGLLTWDNDHKLAEALFALTHHLGCQQPAPSPAPGDGGHEVAPEPPGWFLDPTLLKRLADEFAPQDRPRRLLAALRQRPLLGEEEIQTAVYSEVGPAAAAALCHDLLELHAAYACLVRPLDDGLGAFRGFYHSIQRSVGAGVMLRAVQAAGWEKADEDRGVAVAEAARNKVPFENLGAAVGVDPTVLAALLGRMRRLLTRKRRGAER
jgi:hypothetical protein